MSKKITLALIIPAYNEQSHIRDCLESIAAQTVKPDEVIVVDNNCSDGTIDIAREYDFVRVVREKKQGLIAARNKGLNTATSDLLGRIDADTVLTPEWVATAKQLFRENPELGGVTGPGLTYFLPFNKNMYTSLWSRIYFRHVFGIFRFPVLWGPNMVVRRSVWEAICDKVCTDDKLVHEDQDVTIVMRAHGFTTHFSNDLVIRSDGDRLSDFKKAVEYKMRQRATKRRYEMNGMLAQAQVGGIGKTYAYGMYVSTLPMTLFYYVGTALLAASRKLNRQ